MISKEIKAVAGTKLFCGINKEKTKQFTVYANTVDNASSNNAMVLPVPFPDSVVFHNLEKYKDFFSDCERSFFNMKKSLGSFTNSFGTDGILEKKLDVYDIGSYKVSLAHSLNDLKRVDTGVFELSTGLEEMLQKHYSNPVFGFIICKLAEKKEKYHPFAYSHNIASQKVFIPTKHYHDENNNSQYNNYDMFSDKSYTSTNIDNSPMFSSWAPNSNSNSGSEFSNKVSKPDNDSDLADDWDHDIYLYNVAVDSNYQVKKMNTSKKMYRGHINLQFKKIDFPLDQDCRVFNKLEINGNKPNIDLVLETC